MQTRTILLSAAAILSAGIAAAGALAQSTQGDAPMAGAERQHSTADSGAEIYVRVCQGCHMPDGKGASGAATFPSLAANPRLQYPAYPVTMVLRGRGGMPPLAEVLKPEQVAQVVTYVRTHFGNAYPVPVTAEQVKQLAGPAEGPN